MFKLIKYDWMNRWKFFLGAIVVGVLWNVDVMTKLIAESSNESIYTVILSLVIFAMAVILGVDHIRRMYVNLFTEEGQFLFSTPLSGYKILGGKLGAITAECIGIILFAGLVGFIDLKIIDSKFGNRPLYEAFPPEFIIETFKLVLLTLIMYIIFLLTVYLSMALTKSIFSHVRYGNLLSFIFFIIISSITGYISDFFLNYSGARMLAELNNGLKISNLFMLLIAIMAAILFGITGYLLDRKINL